MIFGLVSKEKKKTVWFSLSFDIIKVVLDIIKLCFAFGLVLMRKL